MSLSFLPDHIRWSCDLETWISPICSTYIHLPSRPIPNQLVCVTCLTTLLSGVHDHGMGSIGLLVPHEQTFRLFFFFIPNTFTYNYNNYYRKSKGMINIKR